MSIYFSSFIFSRLVDIQVTVRLGDTYQTINFHIGKSSKFLGTR